MVDDYDSDNNMDEDDFSKSTSDHSGTTDDHTGSGSGGKKKNDDFKAMRNRIIAQEEKGVKNVRAFVIAAFILCTIAVSYTIFRFASQGDQRTFELEVRKSLLRAKASRRSYSSILSTLFTNCFKRFSHASRLENLQRLLKAVFSLKSSTTLIWWSNLASK
jgi:hypothetical protein